MKSSLGRKLINAPYLLWAALFILIPLIIVAYYAFTDTEGNFSFEYIVKIGEYKEVLIRSLVYAAVATAITLVMAYPVAYYMSRSPTLICNTAAMVAIAASTGMTPIPALIAKATAPYISTIPISVKDIFLSI